MDYQQNDFNTYYYKPNKLSQAFSSPLFLTVAVLTSAVAVFSFDIFSILGTIAAWLIYAAAFNTAKNPGTPIKTSGFSMVHGVTRALKIVYLVFSIIIIVTFVGLLVFTVMNSEFILAINAGDVYDLIPEFVGDPNMALEISAAYDEFLVQLFTLYEFPAEMFGFLILVALITVCVTMILSGVFQLVLSFTFCSKLCKFTDSLRNCAKNGGEPIRVRGLGVWFLVLGIIYAISSPMQGGLLIVLYVWYKKFFPAVPDIQVNV